MLRRPRVAAGEADVLEMLPGEQVRSGIHGAVVPQPDQADGMDLEVQVRRRPLRVAGIPDEAEHIAGVDLVAVDRQRRERGEVRVVEEVPLAVA